MSWFASKKPSTPESELVGHALLALVRTMEDDLTGREIPTEIPKTPEPLVNFEPHTTKGAPFFVSPGTAEEVSKPSPESPHPFVPTSNLPLKPKVSREHPDSGASRGAAPVTLPVVASVPLSPAKSSAVPQVLSKPAPLTKPATPMLGVWSTFEAHFREHRTSILLTLGIASLLLLAVVGGYYWWSQNQPSTLNMETPASPAAEIPEIEPAVKLEGSSQPQYSSELPNILSFDTETITAENIKSTLLQTGQSLQRDGMSGAVEFLIRDQKLNPLALSRFAYLAKLRFPETLLGTLDEAFSLYIVIDAGRPRTVLLTNVKSEATFMTELKRNEKSLAQAIEPLFLDVTTAPKTNLVFRDGKYLEHAVRFVNVDPALELSVDYALMGKQWIVGTSKNSLRMVLDRLDHETKK